MFSISFFCLCLLIALFVVHLAVALVVCFDLGLVYFAFGVCFCWGLLFCLGFVFCLVYLVVSVCWFLVGSLVVMFVVYDFVFVFSLCLGLAVLWLFLCLSL